MINNMKKRKLNSKNPKYNKGKDVIVPKIKEKRLIANNKKIKAYGVFEENE